MVYGGLVRSRIDRDDLSPSRGITLGCAVSAAFWLTFCLVYWWMA